VKDIKPLASSPIPEGVVQQEVGYIGLATFLNI
jgi:hypothetical protein